MLQLFSFACVGLLAYADTCNFVVVLVCSKTVLLYIIYAIPLIFCLCVCREYGLLYKQKNTLLSQLQIFIMGNSGCIEGRLGGF